MKAAFRVDASEALGTGHLMRCLALAEAIASQGGKCTFFLRNINHYASRFLNGTIHDVCSLDIDETSTIEEDAAAIVRKMFQIADWLVVDHYGLDARWERVVRARAKYILVLDDLADRPHDCDLLVDPGLGRQVSDYAGWMERRTEMLLGTGYAILKSSFADYHNAAPVWPTACRAHVFFGGGSSVAWLPTYVKAMLDAVPTLSLFALGFADEKEMAPLIEIYGSRLKWRRYVEEMAWEYSQCDIAIGSPGTATWERACIGLPSALIATANNQIPILHDLDRQGFCRYLGAAWEFDELKFMELFRVFLQDKSLLLAMRALGVSSVDGNGAQRIVQKLFSKGVAMPEQRLCAVSEVLVPYTAGHDKKTVGWLNSADLQATFGLRQKVSCESHRNWVNSAKDTQIWAICDQSGSHVGNVLLKINHRHRSGYFQIYIGESQARGLGLGERALIATLRAAYETYGLHRVWLHTFPENVRAEALYKKHGFVLEGVERDALLNNGAYVSQRRWSLLASEWRAMSGAGGAS